MSQGRNPPAQVRVLLAAYGNGDGQRRPPLALSAVSPQFRQASEQDDLSKATNGGTMRLKRRIEEDSLSPFFGRGVRTLTVKPGSAFESDISALKWWLLREDDDALELETSEYTRSLAALLPAVSLLQVRRWRTNTVEWIARATHLQELSLEGLASVTDWQTLSALVRLQKLRLNRCSVPTLGWLSTFRELGYLILENCRSDNPSSLPWEQLIALQRLSIKSSLSNASLDSLRHCKKLWSVHIVSGAGLTSMDALADLPNLKELSLSKGDMADISWVAQCKALEKLDLSECRNVTDVPSYPQSLHALDVANFAIGSIPHLSWIRHCDSIRVLNLLNCKGLKEFSSISHFRNLVRLNLAFSSIQDITWIGENVLLEHLSLLECKHIASYEPIARLAKLQYLNLSGTAIADALWVSQCTQLRVLKLENCSRLKSLCSLSRLDQLTTLQMNQSGIEDLTWVADCNSLQFLDVSGCRGIRTDATVERPPAKLRVLNMEGCQVRDVQWLRQCRQLITVNVNSCPNVDTVDWVQSLPCVETLGLRLERVEDYSSILRCRFLKNICISEEVWESLRPHFPDARNQHSLYIRPEVDVSER